MRVKDKSLKYFQVAAKNPGTVECQTEAILPPMQFAGVASGVWEGLGLDR